MKEPPANRNAVLIHNGAIGDFLMFIYLAELLRMSGYVDRSVIIVPRNFNFLQGLIGAYPYISAMEVSRRGGAGQLLKISKQVRLIVLPPTVGEIPLRLKLFGWCISRFRGADLIGFQDKGPLCRVLYTQTLTYKTNQLYSESIQDIVRAIGAPVLVRVPALKIVPDLRLVREYGLRPKQYMVFHPGASAPKRSFSILAARELVQYVLERNPAMRLVLSGSVAERNWIEEIRNGISGKERVVSAIGCSAQELAAFMQSTQLFIGTDSGITHLACFLRVPVIVAAHYGTANWLPFYCPTATVLYRLSEEKTVHQTRAHLDERRRERLKPLGTVPTDAICAAVDRFVCHCSAAEGGEVLVDESPNTSFYSQS